MHHLRWDTILVQLLKMLHFYIDVAARQSKVALCRWLKITMLHLVSSVYINSGETERLVSHDRNFRLAAIFCGFGISLSLLLLYTLRSAK